MLPSQTINQTEFWDKYTDPQYNKQNKKKITVFREPVQNCVGQQSLSSVDGSICLDKITENFKSNWLSK